MTRKSLVNEEIGYKVIIISTSYLPNLDGFNLVSHRWSPNLLTIWYYTVTHNIAWPINWGVLPDWKDGWYQTKNSMEQTGAPTRDAMIPMACHDIKFQDNYDDIVSFELWYRKFKKCKKVYCIQFCSNKLRVSSAFKMLSSSEDI